MEKFPAGGFGLEDEKFPPAFTAEVCDVDVGSTDEEIMLFLRGRKAGDSVPANVITEVNPFSLKPWDSPEGAWYLYNSSKFRPCVEGRNIEVTRIGYWKPMDDITIFKDNNTSGMKKTLEFYIGPKPFGNRTGWMMHEYHRDQNVCHGSKFSQYCKSMYRMFWQNDQILKFCDSKLFDEEKHSSMSSYDDNDNDDDEHLESMLMKFLEDEENSSSTNTPNKSEPFTGGEPPAALEESRPSSTHTSFPNSSSSSPSDFHSYLELNDLRDPDSASSCSGDSGDSVDYFDPEELLSQLRGASSQNTQQEQNYSRIYPSASDGKPERPADNFHPKRTHSRSSDCSSNSYWVRR